MGHWLLLRLLVCVALLLPKTEAFVTYLECWKELDPEEIIMHDYVQPASSALHQVTMDAVPLELPASLDKNIVAFELSIQRPEALQQSSSLQYVMEVVQPKEDDDDENDDEPDSAPSPSPSPSPSSSSSSSHKAEFVMAPELSQPIVKGRSSIVMCDGMRSMGRKPDQVAFLRIEFDSNLLDTPVTVVAGWAKELAAVTLTFPIHFYPNGTVLKEGVQETVSDGRDKEEDEKTAKQGNNPEEPPIEPHEEL